MHKCIMEQVKLERDVRFPNPLQICVAFPGVMQGIEAALEHYILDSRPSVTARGVIRTG